MTMLAEILVSWDLQSSVSGEDCNKSFSEYHILHEWFLHAVGPMNTNKGEKTIRYVVEHKKFNTYTKYQLCISTSKNNSTEKW